MCKEEDSMQMVTVTDGDTQDRMRLRQMIHCGSQEKMNFNNMAVFSKEQTPTIN